MIELPNNSTITKINAHQNIIKIEINLPTGENKILEFAGVKHAEIHYGWNKPVYIERLQTELPNDKLIEFLKRNADLSTVKVFSFVNSIVEYPLVKVIAERVSAK